MEENVRILTALSIALTGAIIGWMNVLKPFLQRRKDIKDGKQKIHDDVIKDDKLYRKMVLEKLGEIEGNQTTLRDCIADIQRADIERSYCMFVIEHRYCPSGMKMALSDMYDTYSKNGYNHIAKGRVTAILELPEFPGQMKEANQ